MKHRLNGLLTQEDFDIWDRLSEPHALRPGVSLWGYVESDRRDADIMLAMVEWGFRRFDMVSQRYFFCLPDRLREWWYWGVDGKVGGPR